MNLGLLKSLIKKRLFPSKGNEQKLTRKEYLKLANQALSTKDWDKAIKSLNTILKKYEKDATAEIYAKLGKAYRKNGQLEEADKILDHGLNRFSENVKIKAELAEVAMADKDWVEAGYLWDEIIEETKGPISAKTYLRAGVTYRKLENLERAESILQQGSKEHPEDYKIGTSLAEIAMQKNEWKTAVERWQLVCDIRKDQTPAQVHFELGIAHQLLGDYIKSDAHFKECLDERSEELKAIYNEGYRKVVLFDNGDTRIEFYKITNKTNTVCITFDSINMTWNSDPFGFGFLMKQNVDIMAIRRRTTNNYHQDLSLEEFVGAVDVPSKHYGRKVAYGFSLGAYCALYYGSSLNCEILSLSPRNSAHPKYGDKLKVDIEFTHHLSHPYNANIAPVIAYDPKDRIDNTYIEKELKKSYPHAKFIKTYYAGHRTAPYFLQIGVLKDLVIRSLRGEEIPVYDRKLRWKSHQYLRVLGNACLKRNKNRWGLYFGERALELAPKDPRANLLKIKALERLGHTHEAVTFAENAVKLAPKNVKLRLILIDLYLKTGELEKAKKATDRALRRFKESRDLKLKKKKVAARMKKELVTA